MAANSFLKRSYRLTAEIVSFRPSHQLPDDLVDVFFKGSFPEELLELFSLEKVEDKDLRFTCSRASPSNAVELSLSGEPFVVEFLCGPFDFATALSKEPRMVIEMRSTNGGSGVVGIATVLLSQLLSRELMETWASVFCMGKEEDAHPMQQRTELGEILIRIQLKDKGVTAQPSLEARDNVKTISTPVSPQADASFDEKQFKEHLRSSMEREFEIWKKEEMEKHMQRIKKIETERMAFLENEWRRHEQQREKEFKDLKTKLQDQTQKATCALKDAEERERKVIVLQESLLRRRKDLERQHTSKLQETDDTINRLQKDFEHHLGLERQKLQEAAEKSLQLRQQLKSAELRSEKTEGEIVQLKKSNVQSQVFVLEEELASFKKMYSTAQERIATLEDEKIKYKSRIVELAQQLGAIQAQQLAETHSRVQPLAPIAQHQRTLQEKEIPGCSEPTAEEFLSLRNELEALKLRTEQREAAHHPVPTHRQPDGAPSIQTTPVADSQQQEGREDEEIQQLLMNRTELLATGVYEEHDELIQELDARIQQRSQLTTST